MIESKENRGGRPKIDLTGPDGNVFYLLGLAKRWSADLGKDWDAIKADATSGDYEHTLAVLEREFGEYVTFLR